MGLRLLAPHHQRSDEAHDGSLLVTGSRARERRSRPMRMRGRARDGHGSDPCHMPRRSRRERPLLASIESCAPRAVARNDSYLSVTPRSPRLLYRHPPRLFFPARARSIVRGCTSTENSCKTASSRARIGSPGTIFLSGRAPGTPSIGKKIPRISALLLLDVHPRELTIRVR
jgi:hypothetical protein